MNNNIGMNPSKDSDVEKLSPADARTMRWKVITTDPIAQHN